MSLPNGTWQIDGNGFHGELRISGVDAAGDLVNSAVLIDAPRLDIIEGFWDEDAKRIEFIRILDRTDPARNQIYTGHLFTNERDHPTDLTYTPTGHFEAFRGTGGTARRPLHGWFATTTVAG